MLVVVLSLLACHSLVAPTFVPFTYVSPAPVYGPAYATNYFKASLCSQSAYDGMLITVDLNLPYTPWSMSAGSVLGVQVATDAQLTNIITNNTVNGQLLPTWSFPYSLSYGDLYFRVSNGASPNIVYTVSLVFYLSETRDSSNLGYHALAFTLQVGIHLRRPPTAHIYSTGLSDPDWR